MRLSRSVLGAILVAVALMRPCPASAATLVSISVIPTNLTLKAGFAADFAATGNFSDGTQQDVTELAQWSTSNVRTAIVSNVSGTHGLVTAVSPGTVSVIASVQQGAATIKGSTKLIVIPAAIVSLSTTPVASVSRSEAPYNSTQRPPLTMARQAT
jgi:hypothetical protein